MYFVQPARMAGEGAWWGAIVVASCAVRRVNRPAPRCRAGWPCRSALASMVR